MSREREGGYVPPENLPVVEAREAEARRYAIEEVDYKDRARVKAMHEDLKRYYPEGTVDPSLKAIIDGMKDPDEAYRALALLDAQTREMAGQAWFADIHQRQASIGDQEKGAEAMTPMGEARARFVAYAMLPEQLREGLQNQDPAAKREAVTIFNEIGDRAGRSPEGARLHMITEATDAERGHLDGSGWFQVVVKNEKGEFEPLGYKQGSLDWNPETGDPTKGSEPVPLHLMIRPFDPAQRTISYQDLEGMVTGVTAYNGWYETDFENPQAYRNHVGHLVENAQGILAPARGREIYLINDAERAQMIQEGQRFAGAASQEAGKEDVQAPK